MAEHKNEIPRVPAVSRVFTDGSILELIYESETPTTQFVLYRDGSITMEESMDAGNEYLVPISPGNNLLKHKAVLLPTCPEPYTSIENLSWQNFRHTSTATLTSLLHSFVLLVATFS